MKELFDEQLSQHFKGSFEDFSPAFNEADWKDMSRQLDTPKGFNKRFLVVFAVAASSLFAMTNNSTLVIDTAPFTMSNVNEVVDVFQEGIDSEPSEKLLIKDVQPFHGAVELVESEVVSEQIDSQERTGAVFPFFRSQKKNQLIAKIFKPRNHKKEFSIKKSTFYSESKRHDGPDLNIAITSEMCDLKRGVGNDLGAQENMGDLLAYQDFSAVTISSELNSSNQNFLNPPTVSPQEGGVQVFQIDSGSPNTFSFSQDALSIEDPLSDGVKSVKKISRIVEAKEEPIVQTAHFSWEVRLPKSGLSISPFIKAPLPNGATRNLDRYLAGGLAINVPIQ